MWISEFEASLVYRVSSRTARAIQRNPVSKNKQTNKQQKKGIKNLLLEGFRFVCAGRGELYMNQGLLGGKADALLQNLQSASMLVNCFLLCLKFSFYFTCMCFAYMYACTPCG